MTDLPVVFVPGLGGSFNLGVLLDLSGPTINGWSFPPFVDYGQQFLRTLTSAGYVRDRTLFVAFYDWRKPVDDSARLYLVPWIDRALKRSGRDKVILVAHSMGGLVARAYVQSRDYRGDVAQVITLGTPHRGTPVGYFPWEGGDLRWDGIARVALEVYLWYLGHLHPFQTALDPLAVIRTQARGLRDVLPIYDYLFSQGPPLKVKPEDQMVEQNGWGELVNAPLALDTLFGRTKMSTINGTGFTTLESIVVQAPPQPPGTPPRYPDGRPVAEQSDALGDGTVPLASAAMTDSRCYNLPPLTIPHGSLPDLAAAQVLAELNVAAPATPAPRAATPRLVLLTASPVEITVELPPEEPVVAQAAAAPGTRRRRRRPTRPRTHQHGHPAKRYTMVVIPNPPAGNYRVHLRGTATGTFSLGAMMVGVQSTTVASPEEGVQVEVEEPVSTPITETSGRVATGTHLYYQVACLSYAAPPAVRLDHEATLRDAVERLRTAAQEAPTAAASAPEADTAVRSAVEAALSAADVPEAVRSAVSGAISGGDDEALGQMTALLAEAEPARQVAAAFDRAVERMLAHSDPTLALGLARQLRQVMESRG